ncbi:iron ABC transporter ATP-binding protein [Arcanobacterium hippocoleae]|uniref:Iron complex transport system ATP-binding protein n=1 Tax=Arcanobacterium hippocoleae TaxID=149017 RepID=A0ABU1T342_9ACTO|nr:ATP-binding cassette domain-containing protein [Arcanobacterium hippocoleae]MDR6939786.1 iron complex transport system ATP-binding protein [Arcanobacterium hippocoleae]
MIELQNVTMSYGQEPVVDNVSLTLPDHGLTALIGPNGAGKSTLLSGIGRLQELQHGTVAIDGVALADWHTAELAKSLAVLRQENHMTVRLTVTELVMLGRHPHNHGRIRPEDEEIAARVLEWANLTKYSGRFLDQLSGGQRQRAFIAMTLAQGAKHILLDEPLSSLDLRNSRDLMRHLWEICQNDVSIVMVIHDINIAAAYADRLIAMKNGRVVADGTPLEVMQPQVLEEVFEVETHITMAGSRPVAVPVP